MIFVSHITRLNHHDNGLGCGGVSLFMILSGFLMFYNHGDEIDGKVSVSGLWRAGVGYYKKGLGKFYKGHIITFVSGALLQAYWLIRWFSVEGFWGAVQTAVPNILLFQSFIPKGEYYFSYNAVSWFLCDILFFYFCFPFLAQMIKRQKIFLGGGTAAAVVLLYVLFAGMAGGFPEQKWLLYICPLVRLADFGLGMVLCAQFKDRLAETKEGNRGKKRGTLLQIGSIVLMAVLVIGYPYVPEALSYGIIYILPSMLCIYSFLCFDTKLARLFAHKFWHTVSMVSMEAYLVHQMVIRYLDEYSREMQYISGPLYLVMICTGTAVSALYLRFPCHYEQWRRGMIFNSILLLRQKASMPVSPF